MKKRITIIAICIGALVFVLAVFGIHAEKPDVEVVDIPTVKEEMHEEGSSGWVDRVLERMAAEEAEAEVHQNPDSEVGDEYAADYADNNSYPGIDLDNNEGVEDAGQNYYDDTRDSDAIPDSDRTVGEEEVDESGYTSFTNGDTDDNDPVWDDRDDVLGSDASAEADSMTVPESDGYYGFTDDEVYEIARIVWLEVGICGCSYYTQYLTACVILNRYLDWGYSSLHDTIHASGQYATADMYTEYDGSSIRIGERTWSAVYDALANTDRNPHYQMRSGANHEVYYFDAEWDVCFYY